jgi:hypothetical protein
MGNRFIISIEIGVEFLSLLYFMLYIARGVIVMAGFGNVRVVFYFVPMFSHLYCGPWKSHCSN